MPNGWLRFGCILLGAFIITGVDQLGPWGHLAAMGIGAVGLGNALAVDFTRWWRQPS